MNNAAHMNNARINGTTSDEVLVQKKIISHELAAEPPFEVCVALLYLHLRNHVNYIHVCERRFVRERDSTRVGVWV